MLIVAGCSMSTPQPTATSLASPSPTTAQSSSVSPSPAGDPSTSFDAADPSTWLITEAGIGRASIGSQSAADALSPSFSRHDWCEGIELYEASGPTPVGFSVVTHPGERGISGISVRVPGDVPVTGPVDGSPLTPSGIGLGSTLDELTIAEPSGAFEPVPELPSYVVRAGSRWILFEVSETEPFVRGITVTAVLPPEGFCG